MANLNPEDLTILDNGVPQRIAVFHFDGGASDPVQTPTGILPPNIYSNRPEYHTEPRTLTVLVIDALNTPWQDQVRMRSSVRRYVAGLPPDTRIAVVQLGYRLRVLSGFTAGADQVKSALKKNPELPIKGTIDTQREILEAQQMVTKGDQNGLYRFLNAGMTADQAVNQSVMQDFRLITLAHLDELSQRLEMIQGRKNIVWISGGITSLSIIGSGMHDHESEGGVEDYQSVILEAAKRIAQRGCVLYVVDARGLESPIADQNSQYGSPQAYQGQTPYLHPFDQMHAQASAATWPAAFLMASVTGGRAFNTTNDMAAGLKQAESDALASYSIGFYSTAEMDGRWHRLQVRSTRPDVSLRYREGYLAEAAAKTSEWEGNTWRSVIFNPLAANAIHLDAQVKPGEVHGSLAVDLRTDPMDISFHTVGDRMSGELELCVAEISREGNLAAYQNESTSLNLTLETWKLAQEVGIPYRRTWTPKAGISEVRIVVRDKSTNQYGTLDVPVRR